MEAITLTGIERQTFDMSLIEDNNIDDLISPKSIDKVLSEDIVVSENENSTDDQDDVLDDTAAGEEQAVKGQSVDDVFAARDGEEVDVSSTLRNATFNSSEEVEPAQSDDIFPRVVNAVVPPLVAPEVSDKSVLLDTNADARIDLSSYLNGGAKDIEDDADFSKTTQIQIDTLPNNGTLYVNGVAVSQGEVFDETVSFDYEANYRESALFGTKEDTGTFNEWGVYDAGTGDITLNLNGITGTINAVDGLVDRGIGFKGNDIGTHSGVGIGVSNNQISNNETLSINFDAPVANGEIGLSSVGGWFRPGSINGQATWKAYLDGVEVASGEEYQDASDDGNPNTVVINVNQPFDTIVFVATSDSRSPDFSIQYIEVNSQFEDTFTYSAIDSDGLVSDSSATITLSGAATNYTPDASDDTFVTNEDTQLVIQASELLNNDIDSNNEDTLTIAGVSNSSNGTVALNADGTVTFIPDANFNGDATFDYTISDGNGATDTATATVTVDAVNDAPIITTSDPVLRTEESLDGFSGYGETWEGDIYSIITQAEMLSHLGIIDPDSSSFSVELTGSSVEWHGGKQSDNSTFISDSGALISGSNQYDETVIQVTQEFLNNYPTINAQIGDFYFDHVDFDKLATGDIATIQFDVAVSDGTDNSNTQRVTVIVTGSNDAPEIIVVSTTDSFLEDSVSVGDLVATYSTTDVDGDMLNVTLSDTVNYAISGNSVILTQSGADLVNSGANLPDFTLTPNDGIVDGNILSINPADTIPNDNPPVAVDDIILTTINEGDVISVAQDILARNDYDLDLNDLSITNTYNAQAGVVSGVNPVEFISQTSVGQFANSADNTLEQPLDSEANPLNNDMTHAFEISRDQFGQVSNLEQAEVSDATLPSFKWTGYIDDDGKTSGETDNDFIKVYLYAGEKIILDVDNGDDGDRDVGSDNQDIDMYIKLYDAEGNLLAENDDASASLGGEGSVQSGYHANSLDSYLEYTVGEDGYYYVDATAWDNSSHGMSDDDGKYDLWISIDPVVGNNLASFDYDITDGQDSDTASVTVETITNSNQIDGTDNNEILIGTVGEVDRLNGGGGDDEIIVDTTDIVDGGEGFDTVHIDTAITLDATTTLDFSKLDNVEKINLSTNSNSDTITNLTLDDVLNITDSNNELIITGDSGDAISNIDTTGWNSVSETHDDIAGTKSYEYSNGFDSITLTIDEQIDTTGM